MPYPMSDSGGSNDGDNSEPGIDPSETSDQPMHRSQVAPWVQVAYQVHDGSNQDPGHTSSDGKCHSELLDPLRSPSNLLCLKETGQLGAEPSKELLEPVEPTIQYAYTPGTRTFFNATNTSAIEFSLNDMRVDGPDTFLPRQLSPPHQGHSMWDMGPPVPAPYHSVIRQPPPDLAQWGRNTSHVVRSPAEQAISMTNWEGMMGDFKFTSNPEVHQWKWTDMLYNSPVVKIPAHLITISTTGRNHSQESIRLLNVQMREFDLRYLCPGVVEVTGWSWDHIKQWAEGVNYRIEDWKGVVASGSLMASDIPMYTDITCISGNRQVQAVNMGMDPDDPDDREKNWVMARLMPERWS
jgi:hypothetical protein